MDTADKKKLAFRLSMCVCTLCICDNVSAGVINIVTYSLYITLLNSEQKELM